jgi:hypothetical protein
MLVTQGTSSQANLGVLASVGQSNPGGGELEHVAAVLANHGLRA